MPFLLCWSCGPVQDFIASARKGRDLWFGSRLMSEVTTAAAAALRDDKGVDLILPAPGSTMELLKPDFDVPNKILAVLNHEHPEEVRRIAERASEAARERLTGLAADVFDEIQLHHSGLFDRVPAEQQVADLVEIYWAATARTASFRTDRRRVERLLSARKSARTFSAPGFASASVPKSSLDGQREVVTALKAGLRLGLTHDERLSGVGVLKRRGDKALPDSANGQIPSVSLYALGAWLRPALPQDPKDRQLVARGLADLVRRFGKELVDAGFVDDRTAAGHPVLDRVNPHAFYENRLHEMTETPAVANGLKEEHRRVLAAFRDRVEELSGVRLTSTPNPYYAVILADGDRMGAFIDTLDLEGVRAVSRCLTEFANDVRTRVLPEERIDVPHTLFGGRCVYAGGDDVLAFAPVDVVIRVAQELRDTFKRAFETLDPRHLEQATRSGASLPTLSAGICVAHHLVPLRDVLNHVRKAERIAKDDAGRDAWAIRMLKRSGAPVDAWGTWGQSDNRLLELQEMFRRRDLPGGFPFAYRDALAPLRSGCAVPEGDDVPLDLAQSELIRLLRQKDLMDDAAPGAQPLVADLCAHGSAHLESRLLVARALSGMGGGRS